jgi:anthranilate synthase/aminodeoxychorismate synthase-like glutamine amidotransferase
LGADPQVKRNDAITPNEVEKMKPQKIVISPGPGRPEEAGISMELIRKFGVKIPILGVCLGHQCMGEVYGGKVVRAGRLMHGKTSPIQHDGKGVFQGLPNPFEATRYHSLIVEKNSVPSCLEVCAETAEGEIMGLRHREYPVHGVQFHPESILSKEGKDLLANFLKI